MVTGHAKGPPALPDASVRAHRRSMARRSVAPVDTLWLTMDRPTNPMVIESLMMLDGPVDWDRFLDVLRRRVLDRYPVFRQRLVPSRLPLVPPQWEDDPDFSLDRHIYREVLARPGDDAALQAYLTSGISGQLPRDRPLWELHFIDGYGDGSAVFSRFHHALADGVALTRVLLSMTDDTPDGPSAEVPPENQPGRSRTRGLMRHAVSLAGSSGGTLLEVPKLLTPDHAGRALRLVLQTGAIAEKLLFTQYPESPVGGQPRLAKRAVWAPPIPLADVVTMAHHTGVTVNDVLMAALAGALAKYFEDHDGKRIDIPAMVPVDVRPPSEPLPPELGNRFALVLLILPSGLGTPFTRLAETKRRMDAIKHSPEALLTFGLMRVIGTAGPDLGRLLVDFFANKTSGIITNVRGPAQPRYVVGTRVTRLLGWVPESGNQTLGTCIFTYDGNVHVGFKVDAERVPDPQALADAFMAELRELELLGTETSPEATGSTPPAAEPAPKAAEPTPKAAEPTPESAEPTPKAAEPTARAPKPARASTRAAAGQPGQSGQSGQSARRAQQRRRATTPKKGPVRMPGRPARASRAGTG